MKSTCKKTRKFMKKHVRGGEIDDKICVWPIEFEEFNH